MTEHAEGMIDVDRAYDRRYKSMNPTDPLLAIGIVVGFMAVVELILRWIF